MIRTSYLKNKSLLFFSLLILLFGIVFGVIYYKDCILNIESSNYIQIFNTYRIIIPLLCLILSNIIIGHLFGYFSLFLEGMSISLNYLYYLSVFSFKKLIYYVIYLIINKSLYIILLFLIIIYTGKIVSNLLKKDKDYKYIFKQIKKSTLVIILIIVNELFIYFIGNKILLLFSFLNK